MISDPFAHFANIDFPVHMGRKFPFLRPGSLYTRFTTIAPPPRVRPPEAALMAPSRGEELHFDGHRCVVYDGHNGGRRVNIFANVGGSIRRVSTRVKPGEDVVACVRAKLAALGASEAADPPASSAPHARPEQRQSKRVRKDACAAAFSPSHGWSKCERIGSAHDRTREFTYHELLAFVESVREPVAALASQSHSYLTPCLSPARARST